MKAAAETPGLSPEAFRDRLVLGTAQFGLAYGINNTTGKPSAEAVDELLALAVAYGLRWFDTAAAYGDAEARLGYFLQRQSGPACQVITKLRAASYSETWEQLRVALARLAQPHLYGVLFHDFETARQHPEAWEALLEARSQGLVKRMGVTLYHPWQAEWLLEQQLPAELIQVPFNVFDQRFASLLEPLAAAGTEVHLRSAFLQGLLLRDPEALPVFFQPLAPRLRRLRIIAAATPTVPLPTLLLLFSFIHAWQSGPLARVVIGVDSAANLSDNVAAYQHYPDVLARLDELRELAETDDTFILPYTWPKS